MALTVAAAVAEVEVRAPRIVHTVREGSRRPIQGRNGIGEIYRIDMWRVTSV